MKLRVLYLLLSFACAACSMPETSETGSPPKRWLHFPVEENKAKIVLVSGDEEYRSEEALPQLAKILSKHHGFDCTVLFAQDPVRPGIVDSNYPMMPVAWTKSYQIPGGQKGVAFTSTVGASADLLEEGIRRCSLTQLIGC